MATCVTTRHTNLVFILKFESVVSRVLYMLSSVSVTRGSLGRDVSALLPMRVQTQPQFVQYLLFGAPSWTSAERLSSHLICWSKCAHSVRDCGRGWGRHRQGTPVLQRCVWKTRQEAWRRAGSPQGCDDQRQHGGVMSVS